jgi:hypothetical protein
MFRLVWEVEAKEEKGVSWQEIASDACDAC